MRSIFSFHLIDRAQKIFERRSGRAVSVEETERCLEALAKLGDLAVRSIQQETSRTGDEAKKKMKGLQNAQGP